ncbi:MAG: phosphate/phosphite/phosphonate ABC transporter substrate-binding protein [Alphaproteobacteria bacterium]
MFVARHSRCCTIVFGAVFFTLNAMYGAQGLAQTPGDSDGNTLVLGIVAEINQQKIADHFRDFVRYVARRIPSTPPMEGRVVVAATPARLADLLREKKVDFYMDSPYPTYIINSVQGAGKLLLRRWKNGMAEYESLIFTRRNGETKSLADLRGKIIAFEDPGSTSGYFLPKLFLSRMGFKLSQQNGIGAPVSPGDIGYVFAYTQEKLVDLVITRQAAAGAFSNDDYGVLDDKKKADITVLAETERLPRHLLSIRTDMPSALAERLAQILMAMHNDPEGRLILARTDETTKFDELPGGEEMMRRRLLETFFSPDKK